jgi:hypothetical protein
VSSRYLATFIAASKHNYDVHVTTDIHKEVVAGQRVRVYDVTNWHSTTLLPPYALGLIGFQAVFCCFSRIRNINIFISWLIRLVWIYGRVSAKSMEHFPMAIFSPRPLMRTPLLSCTLVCVLCSYLLRVYPLLAAIVIEHSRGQVEISYFK